jgi:uncharacterized protein (DUF2147 family)
MREVNSMNLRARKTRTAAVALALAAALWARAGEDVQSRILGNWLSEAKDGVIQITVGAGGLYEGRIVGGSHPGRMDEKNPDPSLRGRSLLGAVILHHLHYDGAGKWSGGLIYEPDTGRTYKCSIELIAADDLRVRGYFGISLLGKSQIWTRYRGTTMLAPAAH